MAGKKAVSKGSKATYLCNVTVRHDGERYSKGEEIELFTSEAEHLLAAGSISPKLVPADKGAAKASEAPAPVAPAPAANGNNGAQNS